MEVLILIVVDNGLVHKQQNYNKTKNNSLNPYCSGQWSRTDYSNVFKITY